jgi:hypothetical protein
MMPQEALAPDGRLRGRPRRRGNTFILGLSPSRNVAASTGHRTAAPAIGIAGLMDAGGASHLWRTRCCRSTNTIECYGGLIRVVETLRVWLGRERIDRTNSCHSAGSPEARCDWTLFVTAMIKRANAKPIQAPAVSMTKSLSRAWRPGTQN